MELISIVVPVYNVKQYIQKCLESIKMQTYPNLEIIIIDDGSKDESGKICDEFARKDERFKVFHQRNLGAAMAKNSALDKIQGEFFCFVDSDDFLEPDYIEEMWRCIKNNENEIDIIECGFFCEYLNGVEAFSKTKNTIEIVDSKEYLKNYIKDWTCSLLWNKLYRSNLLGTIRFKKERRCIDDEFFTYKIIMNANKVGMIHRNLYHYRKRKSSVISSVSNARQISIDVTDMLMERYKIINKFNKNLGREYLIHMNDFLVLMIQSFYLDDCIIYKIKKELTKNLFISIVKNVGIIQVFNMLKWIQMSKEKIFKINTFGVSNKESDLESYYE